MTEIGALAIGETPTADDLATGIRTFNRMIGNWSIQNLMIYATTEETFPLVASQATYTMGPAGNFVTTRPKQIDRASILWNGNELPLGILTEGEWQTVQQKSSTSDVPIYLYPNATYPAFSLTIFPVPSDTSKSLKIYSLKPLTKVTAAGTVIDLPDGYELALVYNFAILLCTSYSRAVTPELAAIASKSLGDVKRANLRTPLLQTDPALAPRRRYNIYTGK